jgi:ubiquinone/menaquinone biosynthesis C-methylase UbiE
MNKFWLEKLHCIYCEGSLGYTRSGYYCKRCRKKYASCDGIPILIDLDNIPEHLKKQIQYFEKEDEARPKYLLEPWQQRYVEAFCLRYAKFRQNLIIDNATGSGYMAIELAKKGYHVFACDLTVKELIKLKKEVTRQHLEKYICLVCATSEKLPFKTKVATGMVANAILEHLPKEKQAIDEISRVLKKRATLMVAMPLSYHLIFPAFWIINILHDRRIGHLRRYTRRSILDKFSQFSEVNTYYTGHLFKVICLAIYFISKLPFVLNLAEIIDKKFSKFSYGASNVVSILSKL